MKFRLSTNYYDEWVDVEGGFDTHEQALRHHLIQEFTQYDSWQEGTTDNYEFGVLNKETGELKYFKVGHEYYTSFNDDDYVENNFEIKESEEKLDIKGDRDWLYTKCICYPDPKNWPPKSLEEYTIKEPISRKGWKLT